MSISDHQLTLTAGSSSVEATLTARDDDREEGDEKIRLAATHDGDAIGNATVRIIDRFPGPRVEITFEGVYPPDDDQDAGIATGPFTTRFTFSEEVEGFTVEDIDWQTHSGTTEDSTNIGVHLWDFTEVRAGIEYAVEMMATQAGRLAILVFPGKARSVATGDGNQLGANSLRIKFPKDRMIGGTRGPARNRRVRRRCGTAGYGLALLLAATVTWWGCTDDVVGAPGGEADPGFLRVQLTVPSETGDIAAMLVVEGPAIDSVRTPGFDLFQPDMHASARRQVIVSGALSTGTILEFRVPDRGEDTRYRVRLLQVAGDDYTLRDLSDYTAVISHK